MRACNELDRLAAARPQIVQRVEDVMDAAEADRLLHRILASAPAPRRARASTLGQSLGRPYRAGLLASGLAVTVVAAIVLASGNPAEPGGSPAAHSSSGERPTGGGQPVRQVLLAAASVAAVSQDARGRYWYVKETLTEPGYRQVQETWTPPNGTRQWVWAGKKSNNRVMEFPNTPGFSLTGDIESLWSLENLPPVHVSPRPARHMLQLRRRLKPGVLTFGQLQKLPANPAALTAKIVAINSAAERGIPLADPQREQVFLSLTNLVAGLPVPPQVRAAAFRAMAALPGVTSLGPTDGGQGLRFGLGGGKSATLVVDPATSQVKETLTVVGVGGEVSSDSVAAQWTNRRPR
ncbi:MAG TPA: CU044_5270 family protein [Streptosporangiaceae bacterium]|nr:CU044_5270 family protein [Streptosporangiaceae bacterium]